MFKEIFFFKGSKKKKSKRSYTYESSKKVIDPSSMEEKKVRQIDKQQGLNYSWTPLSYWVSNPIVIGLAN